MRFYNSKQKRELENTIRNNWGAGIRIEEIFPGGRNRLWLASPEIGRLDLDKLRTETIGTYFATIDKRGELRLSIEGSMIVGPKATRNVTEINSEELEQWIRGINLEKRTGKNCYLILKSGNDYVGCGKAYSEGILNHVPKERRIKKL